MGILLAFLTTFANGLMKSHMAEVDRKHEGLSFRSE
jgi:hypothetical protein